jgi:hypothetical protein
MGAGGVRKIVYETNCPPRLRRNKAKVRLFSILFYALDRTLKNGLN